MDENAMLHFRLAEIVKTTSPPAKLAQHIRNLAGNQNMTRITTIHYALGHIDAAPSDVAGRIDIFYSVNGTGVDPHPQFEFSILVQNPANLESAPRWGLRITKEHQRHSVSGGQPDQLFLRFRPNELVCAANGLLNLPQTASLLLHR
jgi:hypothetical protein